MAWELDGELFSEGAYSATFRGRTMPSTLSPYFVRNSNGTDTSRSGVLSTKGVNVPCYDAGDGLILEAAATNLLVRSDELNSVSWIKRSTTTVTPSAAISPDGTQNADKIVVGSGMTYWGVRQIYSKAGSAIQYTYSVYLKAAEIGFAIVSMSDAFDASYSRVGVNLSTGAVSAITSVDFTGASVRVEDARNGWWRVMLTATTDTDTIVNCWVRLATSLTANPPTIAGDSASGIYAFRAQLETGPFATSPIPTGAAAVTRAAAYIGNVPLADLGLVSKTNDYSFHFAYKVPHSSAIGPNDTLLSLHDSTDAEYVNLVMSSTAGRVELQKVSSNGNYTLLLSGLTFAAGSILNIRGTINATEMRLYVNASSANSVTQGTDTNAKNGFALDISEAVLGTNQALSTTAGAAGAFPGFTVYDYALTDAELAALDAGAFDFAARRSAQKLVTVGKLMGR